MSEDNDELILADEGDLPGIPQPESTPWKILIVDDEEEIHRVTRLTLGGMRVHNREIKMIHAYSGRESVEIMRQQPDIAMVLMDVVMEDEHAGLQAVQKIREELGNSDVRLILRTGQPGQAPEMEVVTRYDINDYKEKTELTSKKMHTLMHTSLGHYRELMALKKNREGLTKIIDASANIFESRSMKIFARGVLEQLKALLYAGNDALLVKALAARSSTETPNDLTITVGAGDAELKEDQPIEQALPGYVVQRIRNALTVEGPHFGDGFFTARFSTVNGHHQIVYLSSDNEFSVADRQLVELFCRNVGIAFDNQMLHQEVLESQHKLVMLLSAAVEERSLELCNHVRRVSEYASVMGHALGFDDKFKEILGLSAALHDIGKIGIPDDILNKPGKFTPAERAEMETHVIRGISIIGKQSGELLNSAATVVATHHERWDGTGYPEQLAGEDIPLLGRITAIADVFDALSTDRVYKSAWPMDEVIDYIRDQAGKQFDPHLVEVFLNNLDPILEIHRRWYLDIGTQAA